MSDVDRLPYSIRALLESAVRQLDGTHITDEHIRTLADWKESQFTDKEIPFKPARVILQDFTGVPAIVDLAAMRSAVKAKGGDISTINPRIPVDLVVDHSVIMDVTGNGIHSKRIFNENMNGTKSATVCQMGSAGIRSVQRRSPGVRNRPSGEYGISCNRCQDWGDGGRALFLDTLVGTDSHTTMINSLGISAGESGELKRKLPC